MKCKGIIIAKMFLEKNKFHTVWLILSDFKTYYKTVIIKIVWC
jgi:hypothetical protein